jgi:hypothetical protein
MLSRSEIKAQASNGICLCLPGSSRAMRRAFPLLFIARSTKPQDLDCRRALATGTLAQFAAGKPRDEDDVRP